MTHLLGRYFLWLLLSIGFSSCLKEDKPTDNNVYPEFIVFGQFTEPNNCFGDIDQCINIYKIDASGVFEDANSNVPSSNQPLNGEYTEGKSPNAYNNIQELFRNNPIPEELLNSPSGTIGSAPTWANNFYIEYKTENGYQHWIIDGSFDGSLPNSIQQFVNVISQAVNQAFQG